MPSLCFTVLYLKVQYIHVAVVTNYGIGIMSFWLKHLSHLIITLENILWIKKSFDDQEWLCNSCHKYLKKNKVSPQAAINGLQFPKKPEFIDLNELECRLVAPRLAFQKLLQAPRGKQLKISGNVVNVPADVTDTVHILPRVESASGTIKIQLKRKLKYKSSALSLNVRPHKVFQAAKWLSVPFL